jgi:methyl-accepting chemotaxis protein
MNKRKRIWIEPAFQKRMILHWTLMAFLVTISTYLITTLVVLYSDKSPLFMALSRNAGVSVTSIDKLILPTLLVSAVVGFVCSCLAGLFYSHRLAGPIYRFKKTINDALQGKDPGIIVLRRNDEMKELATALNQLLQRVHHPPTHPLS